MTDNMLQPAQLGADRVFTQLNGLLQRLTNNEYTMPCKVLSGATIGQHVRHIAELFAELDKGYNNGTVNYERRRRDYRVETDKEVALMLLQDLYAGLYRPDKNILLEGDYSETGDETVAVPSTYFREVIYNLEHAIHHMALIRIGINDISALALPESFGVASSTVKYRKACAQ